MAASKHFKEALFSYGSVKVGEPINFEFELKDEINPEQIEYAYPDCGGCTTWKREGKKIIGTVKSELAGANQIGSNQITKIIYVKAKDGKSYFRGKPDGSWIREVDQSSPLERLQIFGVIVKDK